MPEGDQSCLVKELAQYIYDGSELMQQRGTIKHVASMVKRNLHHTVYIREGESIVGVAVYMMVTNSTLEKIVSGEFDLRKPDIFKMVEKEESENMHVFTIRADRMSLILRGTKNVIRNLKPKTISYFKDDELKNLRMRKCRQY